MTSTAPRSSRGAVAAPLGVDLMFLGPGAERLAVHILLKTRATAAALASTPRVALEAPAVLLHGYKHTNSKGVTWRAARVLRAV